MKPTTNKLKNGLYFIIALSFSLLVTLESLKGQSVNASQYIYGVDSLGRIYPVNVADATKGAVINTGTTNTPSTAAGRFN